MSVEFAIPVRQLESTAGMRSFHFSLRAGWLRGALEDVDGITATDSDGEVDVELTRTGRDVLVRGSAKVDLSVACARCLAPFTLHVEPALQALMVTQAPTPSTEEDLTSEEADVVPFDGETVVLDDLVRDELLLSVPMIPLCSADCPGIHSSPSQEAEPLVDPRLAPLLRFKTKNST